MAASSSSAVALQITSLPCPSREYSFGEFLGDRPHLTSNGAGSRDAISRQYGKVRKSGEAARSLHSLSDPSSPRARGNPEPAIRLEGESTLLQRSAARVGRGAATPPVRRRGAFRQSRSGVFLRRVPFNNGRVSDTG